MVRDLKEADAALLDYADSLMAHPDPAAHRKSGDMRRLASRLSATAGAFELMIFFKTKYGGKDANEDS